MTALGRTGATGPGELVPWKPLVLRGVLSVVAGVLALAWPGLTLLVLGVVWGVWALGDGVAMLAQASSRDLSGWRRWAVYGLAAIAVLAGVTAILRPGLALVTITWVLGFWLAVRGIVEIVEAVSSRMLMLRWLVLAAGVVSLGLGLLLMGNPGRGALGLALVLGLAAVAWGGLYVAAGIVVRSEQAKARAVPAS